MSQLLHREWNEQLNVGFIGLGNVGAKLAGSVLRNGFDLTVRDLDSSKTSEFIQAGASLAQSPQEVARSCDVVSTCLPSPSICASVMEADDGVLAGLSEGKIWVEMSTTDQQEVLRLAQKVQDLGGSAADCPVSGGCNRAATGNIAILSGCEREVFDRILPLLQAMGRQVLHLSLIHI